MGDKMKTKRFIALFLAICILTLSISTSYHKETKGAEFVGGVVASIGGAPILGALLIGGVVVAGGIAIHEIVNSTPVDRARFVDGVKDSFHGFVTEYQKNLIIQNNAQMSEHEALQLATQKATETVKNFTDNALNVANTTKDGLKTETVEMWKEYSKEVSDMIDSGYEVPEDITPDTVLNPRVFNYIGVDLLSTTTGQNIGSNTVNVDGYDYLLSGNITSSYNSTTHQYNVGSYNNNNVSTDRYRLYFNILYSEHINDFALIYSYPAYVDIRRLTGEVIYSNLGNYSRDSAPWSERISIFNGFISRNTLPTFVVNNGTEANTLLQEIAGNVNSYLPMNLKDNTAEYLKLLASVMTSTYLGQAISKGRQQAVGGTGDYKGTIFEDENSIPLKKTGLKTNADDDITTGQVGWDLPWDNTWDDVISNPLSFPRVVDETGTIVVPKDVVIDYPTDGSISIPSDTPVIDSEADTDNPDDPYPEKTPEEIENGQNGNYYPTALDLTNIFPFCIPFDIIYLIQNYTNVEESAPVINFKIPYPQLLQQSLGGDGYEVIIDFNDFVAVRNVIRVFLLLFFLVGLMNLTRNIIRG